VPLDLEPKMLDPFFIIFQLSLFINRGIKISNNGSEIPRRKLFIFISFAIYMVMVRMVRQ
jgi:hypothetical protein